MRKSILDEMKELIAEKKGDWIFIANQAGVSYSWLTKAMQGRLRNPGVHTVEAVIDYMQNKYEDDKKAFAEFKEQRAANG